MIQISRSSRDRAVSGVVAPGPARALSPAMMEASMRRALGPREVPLMVVREVLLMVV